MGIYHTSSTLSSLLITGYSNVQWTLLESWRNLSLHSVSSILYAPLLNALKDLNHSHLFNKWQKVYDYMDSYDIDSCCQGILYLGRNQFQAAVDNSLLLSLDLLQHITYAFAIYESHLSSLYQCWLRPRSCSCRRNGPLPWPIQQQGTCHLYQRSGGAQVSFRQRVQQPPFRCTDSINRIDHLHSIHGSKANTIQEELKFLSREKWIWTLLELMIRYKVTMNAVKYISKLTYMVDYVNPSHHHYTNTR